MEAWRSCNLRRGLRTKSDTGALVGGAMVVSLGRVTVEGRQLAGDRWAYQQVREVRAMGDLGTLRQDWDGIADGLSSHAIARGWWPGDGSKLDFAGALGQAGAEPADALRRWGRATLLLEQQNGH